MYLYIFCVLAAGDDMDWDEASKLMSERAAEYEKFLKTEGFRGKPNETHAST